MKDEAILGETLNEILCDCKISPPRKKFPWSVFLFFLIFFKNFRNFTLSPYVLCHVEKRSVVLLSDRNGFTTALKPAQAIFVVYERKHPP